MMATVAVIIPTYNRAAWLLEAIDSVRRQTFADWECLIVDDGSTDETRTVVEQLAAREPRLRYLPQPRFGRPARGRNNGIRASDSRLLAFLDDDDSWHEEKLGLQVAAFEAHLDAGIVFAKIRKYGRKHQVWPADKLPLCPRFADLLRGNFVPTSTVVVRRSVLDAVGPFNERLLAVEDYELWLRIARVSPMVALPQVLCDYRVHDGERCVVKPVTELDAMEQIYDDFQERYGVSPDLLAPGRRSLHLKRVLCTRHPLRVISHLWKALTL
jgi:glycosyltransferase involved in cell wall biosynthesis